MEASVREAILGVVDLTISSAERRVVGPVTFEVRAGESVGLRGPSGAGKSSILRSLVGLLPPQLQAHGTVRVLDCDPLAATALHELRTKAVLVGQSPILFDGSIFDNTVFGLRHHVRARRPALAARAKQALIEAALWDEVAHRLDEPAQSLSAGQRQRLCLARALALDPELLLLDEPMSSLDHESRHEVADTINRLRGDRTIILVSHDRSQLAALCDSIVDVVPA